jgi:hypothetical protein
MTTEELALSSLKAEVKERGAQSEAAKVVACGFCRRRLADEYFFTCRKCDASYCYIHMSRHQPAPCARQVARRQRALAAPPLQQQEGDVRLGGGKNQLLEARLGSGFGSSANV